MSKILWRGSSGASDFPMIEKRPALFIDRDGTINRDCPYCHDVGDLVVYDDAVDIIREYASSGYLVIVISNQSGINRGYFSLEEAQNFNEAIRRYVEAKGGRIDAFFMCPHRPDENCNCRKPKDGLVRQAMEKFPIDLEHSVMVGDSLDLDGGLARNLGIKFIHFKHEG